MSQPLTITPNTHTLSDVEIEGRALYARCLAEAREDLAEVIEWGYLAEEMPTGA
jgi:hypothetical protein